MHSITFDELQMLSHRITDMPGVRIAQELIVNPSECAGLLETGFLEFLAKRIAKVREIVDTIGEAKFSSGLTVLPFSLILRNLVGLDKEIWELTSKFSICGAIATRQKYFYRCYTCCGDKSGIHCTRCWDPSKHVGHRYTMLYCSGTCDCGDASSLSEEGMCDLHKGIRDYEKFNMEIPEDFRKRMMIQFCLFNFVLEYSLVQAIYDKKWEIVFSLIANLLARIAKEKSDVLRFLLSSSFTIPLANSPNGVDYPFPVNPLEQPCDRSALYGMVDVQTMELIFPDKMVLDVETFANLFGTYSLIQFTICFMTQFPLNYDPEKYGGIFTEREKYYYYITNIESRLSNIFESEIIAMKPYRNCYLDIWPVIIPRLFMNQYYSLLNREIVTTYDCFNRGILHINSLVVGNTITDEDVEKYKKELEVIEPIFNKISFTSCGYQILTSLGYRLKVDKYDAIITCLYLADFLKTLSLSVETATDGKLAPETKLLLKDIFRRNSKIVDLEDTIIGYLLSNSTRLTYLVNELAPIFTNSQSHKCLSKIIWSSNLSLLAELERKACYRNRAILELPEAMLFMVLSQLCLQYSGAIGRIKEGVHIDETDYLEKIESETLHYWQFNKFVRINSHTKINGFKYMQEEDIPLYTDNLAILVLILRMWLATDNSYMLFRQPPEDERIVSHCSVFTKCIENFIGKGFHDSTLLPIHFGNHCLKARYETEPSKMYQDKYSLTIPLHRFLSIIGFSLTKYKQVELEDLLEKIHQEFHGALMTPEEIVKLDKRILKSLGEAVDEVENETNSISGIDRDTTIISPVIALAQHPLRTLFTSSCFKLFNRNGSNFINAVNIYLFNDTKSQLITAREADFLLLQEICAMKRKRAQYELAMLILRTFGLEEWITTQATEPVDDIVPGSAESTSNFLEILTNVLLIIGRIYSNRTLVGKDSSMLSICKQSVIDRLCCARKPYDLSTVKDMFPNKYRNGDLIDDFLDEVAERIDKVEKNQMDTYLIPTIEAWKRSNFFNISSLSFNMEQFIDQSFQANHDYPPSVYSLPSHSLFTDKYGVDPLLLLPCTAPVVLLLTKIIYSYAMNQDVSYLSSLLISTALIILVSFKNISASIPAEISSEVLADEGIVKYEEILDMNIHLFDEEEEGEEMDNTEAADALELKKISLKGLLNTLYKTDCREEHKKLIMYLLDIPNAPVEVQKSVPQSPFNKTIVKDFDSLCPICLDETEDELSICAKAQRVELMQYGENSALWRGVVFSFCRHSYHYSCIDQSIREGNKTCSLCSMDMNFSIPFTPSNYMSYTPKKSAVNENRLTRLAYIKDKIFELLKLRDGVSTPEEYKKIESNEHRNMISSETLALVSKIAFYDDILYMSLDELFKYDSDMGNHYEEKNLPVEELSTAMISSPEHALLVLVSTFLINIEYQEQIVRPWELNTYKVPKLFRSCKELNMPTDINRSEDHIIVKTIEKMKESIASISALVCFLNHIYDIVENFDDLRFLKRLECKHDVREILDAEYGMETLTFLACMGQQDILLPLIDNSSIPFQTRLVFDLVHFFTSECPPGSPYITKCAQLKELEERLEKRLNTFKEKNLDMAKRIAECSAKNSEVISDTQTTADPQVQKENTREATSEFMDSTALIQDNAVETQYVQGEEMQEHTASEDEKENKFCMLGGSTKVLVPKYSYEFAHLIQESCYCEFCKKAFIKTNDKEEPPIDFILCLSCGKVFCTACTHRMTHYPRASLHYPDASKSDKMKSRILKCAIALTSHTQREKNTSNGKYLLLTCNIGTIMQIECGMENPALDCWRYTVISIPSRNYCMYLDSRGSIVTEGFKKCFNLQAAPYDEGEEMERQRAERQRRHLGADQI